MISLRCKKFLLFSLFQTQLYSMESAVMPERRSKDDYIQAMWSEDVRENIVIKGVPYLIIPADQEKRYLARNSDSSLCLMDSVTSDSVFLFYPSDDGSCAVQTHQGDSLHGSHTRCLICIKRKRGYLQLEATLLFLKPDDAIRRALSLSKTGNDGVVFTGQSDSSWLLIPHYNFAPLIENQIDYETLLVRLPKKMSDSSLRLTAIQLKQLCKLHKNIDLAVVYEKEDFFYVATPEMLYSKGLYFSSPQCSLKLSGASGCELGRGYTRDEALQNCRLVVDEPCIVMKSGEVIFLRPSQQETAPIINLGNIEIIFGESFFCGLREGFKPSGSNVKTLCQKGYRLTNKHYVELVGDAITVREIGSMLPNAGNVAFLTHVVTQNALETGGSELRKVLLDVTDRIDGASLRLSTAITVVSRDLTTAAMFGLESLNNRLAQALRVFDTSVKLLTTMVSDTSCEIKDAAKIIGADLVEVAAKLESALTETSRNLSEGTSEIKEAIQKASEAFRLAFTEVSTSLGAASQGVGKIPDSLKKASGDFVAGMDNLRMAAECLRGVHVKLGGCVIC